MKIQSTPRDDHQVQLVVEVENEMLERKMHKAARTFAEKAKIPGFRPGKAPYEVVIRYAGEDAIKQDAIELLVEEIYPEMLEEEKIEAGAMGTLDEIVSENPPTFSFIVPLAPVVELGDYKSVRVDYNLPVVEDDAVEETINRYRDYYSTLEPVENPAAEGQIVFYALTGMSGDEEVVPERTGQSRINSDSDAEVSYEFPFVGFNQQLLGVKADDELTVTHTFPEDHGDEKLKGKTVDFKVKVQSVKSRILPDLNEEFIQNFGEFVSVDEFRQKIREQMEQETQAEYDFKFYKDVLTQIVESSTIKYPPQMLEQEKDRVLDDLEHELSHQRMDLDTYLKFRNTTKEALIENDVLPQAREQLERSLVMREIADRENIQLTDEEMQTGYTEALNDLAQTQDLNHLLKQNNREQVINAIAMDGVTRMMNRRIYEILKSIATGAYVSAETKQQSETAAATEQPVAEAISEQASELLTAVEENKTEPVMEAPKPKTRKAKAKAEPKEVINSEGE